MAPHSEGASITEEHCSPRGDSRRLRHAQPGRKPPGRKEQVTEVHEGTGTLAEPVTGADEHRAFMEVEEGPPSER